ncbi:MAG TPA: hypothetical protein VNC78_02120 [Actinomycetota bacterium]|nr:hypothetical protein [Actinomycetota bacterium]
MAFLIGAFASPARASQSDNIRVLQHFDMTLANEIEFQGSRIYVNQYAQGPDAGVHLFEIGKKGVLRELGALVCLGLTDTAAFDKGVIAIGLQQGGEECNTPVLAPVGGTSGGVHVADMSDPAQPRLRGSIALPGGVHTLTRYPNSSYVYTAMSGADSHIAYGGITHIVDVSDPDDPVIAATYTSPLNPAGCHDILFQEIEDRLIGFCPGLGGTEIWDASDPLQPLPIGRMLVPFAQLPHQVAVSSDGKVAAVSDEAYAGHACAGGGPVGALWFYDISDLTAPQVTGFYGPQRGTFPVGIFSGNDLSCTAHNFNFIPDSRLMVVAWIAGGTTVIDITDPMGVDEIAHYRPDGAVAMSSYWYRGRIYAADFTRGFEVLALDL